MCSVLGIPLTSYEAAWRTTTAAVPKRLHYIKFDKFYKIKKTQCVCSLDLKNQNNKRVYQILLIFEKVMSLKNLRAVEKLQKSPS